MGSLFRWGVGVVALLAIAVGGGGVARGTAASRSLIAIHEQGTRSTSQVVQDDHGRFTVDLEEAPFGPGGTTRVSTEWSAAKSVNGQEQTPLLGRDTLTSKKGRIELVFVGTHIDLNGRLRHSGQLVGPAIEYGTWKISAATGVYQGWKGGGNWASVISGYGPVQPYSVEWDGHVTP